MATIDDVRRIALSLPRTTEHLIGGNTKFRVGRLVYASVSADEERLGFDNLILLCNVHHKVVDDEDRKSTRLNSSH